MLGTAMIIVGTLLIGGSLATAYYLITQACSLEAASCEGSPIRLISDLMIANEGIFFWLAWVAAVFLIWGGTRLRAG